MAYPPTIKTEEEPAFGTIAWIARELSRPIITAKGRVKKESVKKESVKDENVKEESFKTESVKTEPVKEEFVKNKSINKEPVKMEPVQTESEKEETGKQEPVKKEGIKSEPASMKLIKKEPIGSVDPILLLPSIQINDEKTQAAKKELTKKTPVNPVLNRNIYKMPLTFQRDDELMAMNPSDTVLPSIEVDGAKTEEEQATVSRFYGATSDAQSERAIERYIHKRKRDSEVEELNARRLNEAAYKRLCIELSEEATAETCLLLGRQQ